MCNCNEALCSTRNEAEKVGQVRTFERLVVLRVPVPGRLAVSREVAQSEVADGQTDDARLVQLARDGRWQGKQLGQLVKFIVLFPSPRAGSVARLFFSQFQNTATESKIVWLLPVVGMHERSSFYV